MNSRDLKKILETSDEKYSILTDSNILSKYNIYDFELPDLINTYLTNEQRVSLLQDTNLVLGILSMNHINKIVIELDSDADKIDIVELYNFEDFQIESILESFTMDSLVAMLSNKKDFLKTHNIKPYSVISGLTTEKQVEFISRLEETGLTRKEKKAILATLSSEAKKQIDINNFSQEYVLAASVQFCDDLNNINAYGKILVDINENLEKYRDLDEFLYVKPMDFTSQERENLLRLCEICPEMKIKDNILITSSTAQEYINAEEWIQSVIQGMDENWEDIQKIAYIDNAIGKRVSYTPDFGTEVCKENDIRALWKIIDSGYGVCNGIAQVEKYMLDRIGVESEIVSSGNHAFLKLKNIEFVNADGEVKNGNTVLDPTWNLGAHRYGSRPMNFCRSYEEIRKNDIRDDGTDTECHRNDEQLADATLELDEASLRQVFKSIGITDREGNFPVKELIEKSDSIDKELLPAHESIRRQFLLLAEYYPEFAKCQNETADILQGTILNQENLNFNKCVVNRVYERNDADRRPVLYVYADLPEQGKKFYFVDKEVSQFVELSIQEFETRFECYDMDLEKQCGIRPWEDAEIPERPKELAQSSGKIVAEEGGR